MLLLSRIIRRLCYVTLYLTLFWLVLAILWAALPFPSYSPESIASFIREGRLTTFVYPSSTYYLWNDPNADRDYKLAVQELRVFFGLQAQLHMKENVTESFVTVGGGYSYLDPNERYMDLKLTNVNISLFPNESNEYLSLAEDDKQKTSLGDRFLVDIATADDDGINLPWFSIGDSAMLFWWIHFDTATIPLRARYVTKERDDGRQWASMEVWPDSSHWQIFAPSGEVPPPGGHPLFTISIPLPTHSSDSSSRDALEFTYPDEPGAYTLSKTYPARIAIGALMVPLGVIGYLLFGFVMLVVKLPFHLAVAIINIAIPLLLTASIFAGGFIILSWIWLKPEGPSGRIPLAEFGRGVIIRWWRWSGLKISFRVSRQKRRAGGDIGLSEGDEGEESILLDLEAGSRTPLPPLSSPTVTKPTPSPQPETLVDVSEAAPSAPAPQVVTSGSGPSTTSAPSGHEASS